MIYTHAAAALISASIAATGAWQIQNWRFDAKEKAHAEQKLVEVQQSAAASIRRADNVISAQVDATARDVGLRRDLNNARTELDRLRTQLAQPMPRAETSPGSCVERADPARELLAACAAELVEMGGIADRINSDRQTLIDAWPK